MAARQDGVVARRQLLEAGISRAGIDRRVARGWLIPLHPGVYAVGHAALTTRGRLLAALLAAGPGAALSHRSAAAAWELLRDDASPPVELTSSRGAGRRSRRLPVHRGRLGPADVIRLRGIPVTTVERTLLDLAEVVPRHVLDRAVDRTVQLRRYDAAALDDLMRRSPGRRGLAPLRAAIAELRPGAGATRSWLERRMLVLVAEHGLPDPEVNVWLAGREVDLLWRSQRLVVELDGRAFHTGPAAFERDRRRDVELRALGYAVLRFTWRQVEREPGWVARHVAAALRAG
jgi:hypothetical protein